MYRRSASSNPGMYQPPITSYKKEVFAKKCDKSWYHLGVVLNQMQLFLLPFCTGWYDQYQFSYSKKKTYAVTTLKEILTHILRRLIWSIWVFLFKEKNIRSNNRERNSILYFLLCLWFLWVAQFRAANYCAKLGIVIFIFHAAECPMKRLIHRRTRWNGRKELVNLIEK